MLEGASRGGVTCGVDSLVPVNREGAQAKRVSERVPHSRLRRVKDDSRRARGAQHSRDLGENLRHEAIDPKAEAISRAVKQPALDRR